MVTVEKNGEQLCGETLCDENQTEDPAEALLTIEDIFDFADTCDLADVSDVLDKQIEYNSRIAARAWKAAGARA